MTTSQPLHSPPPAPAENAEEHRVAQRDRVLKAAKIVLEDWGTVDCQVRDISATGAKIRVESTASVPHKFRLLIIVDNTIRPVQVAWKRHNTLGVTFLSEATKAPIRKLTNGM